MEFRFGFLPASWDLILKEANKGQGLDFSKIDLVSAAKSMLKYGFKHIEITLDVYYALPGVITEKTIDKFIELKEENNLSVSVHLPLWSLEPSSFNEHIREASVTSIVETIRLVEPLNPEVYVLHTTGALAAEYSRLPFPAKYKNMILQYMNGFAAKSVEEIIATTEINPKKLAIENIEFPFELTREIIEEYETSMCFDTGHLLAGYSGNYDFMEFLKMNYDLISEIHLHDGYRETKESGVIIRDHIPLGTGKLPLKEFVDFLKEKNFKGPLVFELSFEEARQSLEYIKKFI